jgi:hypothetical protein
LLKCSKANFWDNRILHCHPDEKVPSADGFFGQNKHDKEAAGLIGYQQTRSQQYFQIPVFASHAIQTITEIEKVEKPFTFDSERKVNETFKETDRDIPKTPAEIPLAFVNQRIKVQARIGITTAITARSILSRAG